MPAMRRGIQMRMDRTRFSFIAHTGMEFCCPVAAWRVDRAIELMGLPRSAAVVDIGAGKCSWLARIARTYGARCTAIEPAKPFAAEARRLHASLINEGRLEIIESDATAFLASRPGRVFDAALCIGSSHAFGTYAKTLDALNACVKPGGIVITGEGYWKKKPDPEYLKALGGEESELTTHAGNILAAIERGYTPLWCSTVTDDEWDEYEWGYSRGIEDFVRVNPEDPDAAAMLKKSRSWRDTVLRWGRDTLGFGIYLLRTSPQ